MEAIKQPCTKVEDNLFQSYKMTLQREAYIYILEGDDWQKTMFKR
jgi:hypothetical protein